MHLLMVYDVTVDDSGENSVNLSAYSTVRFNAYSTVHFNVDSAKFGSEIWFSKCLGFSRVTTENLMKKWS